MKIDQSYIRMPWKKAIHSILYESSSVKPVLIVRKDNPYHGHVIWRHFLTKYKCVYVRMGVICSMSHLYDEILSQLQPDSQGSRSEHEITIRSIVDVVRKLKQSILIVIDNCHHLTLNNIFFLLGLMLETENQARFLLLIVDQRLDEWREEFHPKDPRARLFLQMVGQKIEISY